MTTKYVGRLDGIDADPTPEDFLRVESFGEYKLGKKLGEGAFAVVRVGTHTTSGYQVACKICAKPLIKDEYVRKHLYREAKILQSLRHPNIIQLLETVESESLYVIVLDLCAKDVLTHLCSVGISSEHQGRIYGQQLLSAFEYLHSKHIVHRDLKAENMMLDRNNNLKIIDFGLSNDMTGKTTLTTQCGSMAYSAPELLSSKPYGKEVDIWSIGVCLYVMLTGNLPFGNLTLTDLHAMMLDGRFDLPDNLSDELKDLFTRFFQVKPTKRITIAEAWDHQWIKGTDSDRIPEVEIPQPLNRADVNDLMLIQMVRMGIANDANAIAEAVLENKCNRVTTTYHLLMQKREILMRRLSRRRGMERQHSSTGSRSSTGSLSSTLSSSLGSSTTSTSRRRRTSDSTGSLPLDESVNVSMLNRSNSTGRLRRSLSGARLASTHTHGTITVQQNAITFPPGLDLETQSYSDTVSHIVLVIMEMRSGGINQGSLIELSHLCHRGLRVAPDMDLISILRSHGWSGIDFGPAAQIDGRNLAALLHALQRIESEAEKQDGESNATLNVPQPRTRTSSVGSRPPSFSSDDGGDGLVIVQELDTTKNRRRGNFASIGRPLPGIGNENGRGTATKVKIGRYTTSTGNTNKPSSSASPPTVSPYESTNKPTPHRSGYTNRPWQRRNSSSSSNPTSPTNPTSSSGVNSGSSTNSTTTTIPIKVSNTVRSSVEHGADYHSRRNPRATRSLHADTTPRPQRPFRATYAYNP